MAQNVWLSTADGNYGNTANWSQGHVPAATENVIIPAGTPAITSGFSQSGVAIGSFFVEEGFLNTIGNASNYMSINPTGVTFAGTGLSYINVNAASITIDVNDSLVPTSMPAAGLFLLGSSIATLNVNRGFVGVAAYPGETATITTVNLQNLGQAGLILGSGVTLTTWNQIAGTGWLSAAATTATVISGTLNLRGSGALTTLNNYGATVYPQSTGTITNLNMYGGTTDFSRSRTARTVTTPKIWPLAIFVYDPNVLTLSNPLAPQEPVQLTASVPTSN